LRFTSKAEIKRPPQKQTQLASVAFRGPLRSTHLPNIAADRPSMQERDRVDPAHLWNGPVRAGLTQRHIEDAEPVHLANAHMNGISRRWNHPAVESRFRDGRLVGKEGHRCKAWQVGTQFSAENHLRRVAASPQILASRDRLPVSRLDPPAPRWLSSYNLPVGRLISWKWHQALILLTL
jgi:hypothetical protein